MFYLLSPEQIIKGIGLAEARAWVDALRKAAMDAGLKNPYIANMGGWVAEAKEVTKQLGLDAISDYASGWEWEVGSSWIHHPFSDLASCVEGTWDVRKSTGHKVIPNVMCGGDWRPYWLDGPVPKRSCIYYSEATPQEISNLVKAAMDWNAANPSAQDADTVILYAWDEFGESGKCICPNLYEGSVRLDAIKSMLDSYSKPQAPSVPDATNSASEPKKE